jgi:hypothetical protein
MLGNGINRAYNFASWDDLISSISIREIKDREKEAMKNVPYPLQPVILTNDNIDIQMKKISMPLAESQAPAEEEELLRSYAKTGMDVILTTNYTYELEKALIPDFKCQKGRKCKWRNIAYSGDGKYNTEQLHTYFSHGIDETSIWHIHGEASRPNTMILGHYYYGKLLAKMQQGIPDIIRRYKVSQSKNQDMNIYGWLEYFMLGDIYIVGCGMALSEMDLWWLINCKKRHFPERKVFLYKPDIKTEERLLAEAYGVDVVAEGFDGDYKKYYRQICLKLNNTYNI